MYNILLQLAFDWKYYNNIIGTYYNYLIMPTNHTIYNVHTQDGVIIGILAVL